MRAGKCRLRRSLLGAVLTLAGVGSASAYPVLGLTSGGELYFFDHQRPADIYGRVRISGLQPGESILAIDERPATGQLYGLGSSSRLYVIDRNSGSATAVGTGAFTTPLSGTSFGFDFNPTVDRIRIVSNSGQNLRAHPDTGALAAVDGNLNGAATAADGAAYTNSVSPTPTSTTLYVIDAATDALYTQNPPNNGTLVTVGSLGVNTSGVVGFDIARSGEAVATLEVGGTSSVYSINLTTGAASSLGAVGLNGTVGLVANPLSSPTPPLASIPATSPAWLAGLALLLAGVAFAATRRRSL